MNNLNARGQTLEEFLAEYDETKYRRPSNTVDMILMTVSQAKLKLLLIRRKDHPFINDFIVCLVRGNRGYYCRNSHTQSANKSGYDSRKCGIHVTTPLYLGQGILDRHSL